VVTRAFAILLVLSAAAVPARAQSAEAEILFKEAEKLYAAGKIAEACDKYRASNDIEPGAGTLIKIGRCRKELGELATAWAAFNLALGRVKDPRKRKIADDEAKAIEPLLSYLTIVVSKDAEVPGLEILRGTEVIDAARWNRNAPIDGGTYVFTARAPGREDFTTTVKVPREKGKVVVDIPVLAELSEAVAIDGDGDGDGDGKPIEHDDGAPPSRWTGKRKVALVLAGVSVGAIATGVVIGISAKGFQDDAYALCPETGVACAHEDEANSLITRGRKRAKWANVSYAVAASAAIGATVLWFIGAPRAADEVAIVPRLDDATGVDVLVRF
jgi:hypothetical protein